MNESLKSPYWSYGAELLGTALLVLGGLSAVIFDFGAGSVVAQHLPPAAERRVLTGFLFGATGCLITISPLGRISGAHLNPAVSAMFWWRGQLPTRALLAYVSAQTAGTALGAWALRQLWGTRGSELHYGITVPGAWGVEWAFAGEVFVTFCLVAYLLLFTGHPRLRPFTPFGVPILFAVLVGLEAPLSGTSANPARSFGPALLTGIWTDQWLYWLAPLIGTTLAVGLFTTESLRPFRSRVAKLYHFKTDIVGIFKPKRPQTALR